MKFKVSQKGLLPSNGTPSLSLDEQILAGPVKNPGQVGAFFPDLGQRLIEFGSTVPKMGSKAIVILVFMVRDLDRCNDKKIVFLNININTRGLLKGNPKLPEKIRNWAVGKSFKEIRA